MIKVNINYAKPFFKKELNLEKEIKEIHQKIHEKSGLGSEFLGWLELPIKTTENDLKSLIKAAQEARTKSSTLLVIGIGGSYLGLKAGLEMLTSTFNKEFEILFAGFNLSESYHRDLYDYLKEKDFIINVISKSGTTTEPALAFRIFKKLLEDKYHEKANERIFVTTDKEKGSLRKMASLKGYQTFDLANDIGGRFSVLTAVGLFPLAFAGLDIKEIMRGAKASYYDLLKRDNDAYLYAKTRYQLYLEGKTIETIVNYEPQLNFFLEWWMQLFGESEGKDNKGLFVSSAKFTTDLHSLGQLFQEGPRLMFETVLKVKESSKTIKIPADNDNFDDLNYLKEKSLTEINDQAFLATLLAHSEGGVPNIVIEIEKLDCYHFGYLVYFFFKACAMSAYLLGVNPFNQPGVEAYKDNMFALLGKQGYQELAQKLTKKIEDKSE